MPNRKLIFGPFLIAAVVFAVVIRSMTTPSGQDDPNTLMSHLATEAVKFAADQNVMLDYSPDSVRQVESLLAQLHERSSQGRLEERELNRHSHQFGAYIGEVLRRKYGGHWNEDHKVAGPKSFPVHWNDGESFPVGWCAKRILNGEDDNVWFKYQVVTSDEYLRGARTPPADNRAVAK